MFEKRKPHYSKHDKITANVTVKNDIIKAKILTK